ncbi:MAG: hypothetical protein ACTMIR_13800 [Cellulomonadaceae bacterium]
MKRSALAKADPNGAHQTRRRPSHLRPVGIGIGIGIGIDAAIHDASTIDTPAAPIGDAESVDLPAAR